MYPVWSTLSSRQNAKREILNAGSKTHVHVCIQYTYMRFQASEQDRQTSKSTSGQEEVQKCNISPEPKALDDHVQNAVVV